MERSSARPPASTPGEGSISGARDAPQSDIPDASLVSEPYLSDTREVAEAFSVDPLVGLTPKEAQERLRQFGENVLRAKPHVPVWRRILSQLKDPLVVLLIVAAAVSTLVWALEGGGGAPVEALVVLLVVVFNVVIGLVQESRAADAVAALAKMTEAHATVLRDGLPRSIPAAEVVPGDILMLAEGDQVAADARLIKSAALRVAEASLTGESLPVEKDAATVTAAAPLGDRSDMVYRGTAVVSGTGAGIVVATGMNTEVGSIATLLDEAEEDATPLEKEIDHVSGLLGAVVVGIALVIMVTIALVQTPQTPGDWATIFMLGVSLAVAAVPEGLPAVLSVVLAVGVQKMAKKNAVVKKLSSAETLGSASVICTDKTGTLTQNEMTIREVVTASGKVRLAGVGYSPVGTVDVVPASEGIGARTGTPLTGDSAPADVGRSAFDEAAAVLAGGALANDAALVEEGGAWLITGDPTDAAFLTALRKFAATEKASSLMELVEGSTRLAELPFSSERKMMSTRQRDASGEQWVVTKGAPDVVLKHCTQVLVGKKPVELTEKGRARLLSDVETLSNQAYRTLAVAYAPVRPDLEEASAEELGEGSEANLVYLGVVGMIDPPREAVSAAVEDAHRAGVRVVMITGDHPSTASRIAQDLGIATESSTVLTGTELDDLSDEELIESAKTTNVYARVAPKHKLRVVDALQTEGQVVAMTGDGVNDAPALKSADIGIAMGVTGTEVTKESAKMVLADDNFATIVSAVAEGRAIFDNIRKFLRYLLSANMGEVLTMFFGVVLMDIIGLRAAGEAAGATGVVVPLLATQILWINLVTDTAPALALGVDPQLEDVMARPPRRPDERVIDRAMWGSIFTTGITMAVVTLLTMDLWLPGGLVHAGGDSIEVARTAAFTTLVFANFFSTLNSRSATASAFQGLFTNWLLWGSIALGTALQVAVVEIPFLQGGFGTTSLDWMHWAVAVGAASMVLWVEELRKSFVRANVRAF